MRSAGRTLVGQWSITEPFAGRYRRVINFGGRPYWCMFDYTVTPAPASSPVEVSLAGDADAESREWFPHLYRGIMRGYEAAHERRQQLVGIWIEVRKVYTHPIDTTAPGCEQYGFAFVFDVVCRRSVPIPE